MAKIDDESFARALASIVSQGYTPFAQDLDLAQATGTRGAFGSAQDRSIQDTMDRRLEAIGRQPRVGLFNDPANQQLFSDALMAGLNRIAAPPPSKGSSLFGALVNAGQFVLEAVDTPRALVTSTIKEIGDIFDDSEGTEFSFTELFDQGTSLYGEQAIGAGEVIQEFAPGLGEIELFGVKPLDNVAGFLGEVVLDPFTWMTLGTLPLARQGTMGMVRVANMTGDVALARRLFTRGMAAASGDDIARLAAAGQKAKIRGFEQGADAIRGGVHFRIPGTGNVARAITGGRVSPRSIQLLSQDSVVLQLLPRTQVNRVAQAMRRRRFGRLLGGDRADLKALVRSADATDESWLMAFDAIDVDNVARGLEGTLTEVLQHRMAQVQRQVEDAGFSGQDAYHALAADVIPDGWAPELFEELQGLGRLVRTESNSVGRYLDTDADFIADRKGWQPGVPTDEWAAYTSSLRGTDESTLFDMAGFEQKAGIVPGGRFMGVELFEPSVAARMAGEDLTAANAGRFSPRGQASAILHEQAEHWGDKAFEWFETDLWVALPQHIRSVARRARGVRIENGMRARGHGIDAWTTTVDEVAMRAERSYRAAEQIVDARRLRMHRALEQSNAATLKLGEADEAVLSTLRVEADAKRARIDRWIDADGSSRVVDEAVGMDAWADDLTESAQAARRTLDQFDEASTRNILDLESMAANAERQADGLASDLVRVRGGLARLVRRQDELYAEAAELARTFDDELHEAAERLPRLVELESDIADLDELIAFAEADVATRSASREALQEQIQSSAQNVARAQTPLRQLDDLVDMLEVQRLAASPLNNLRGNWDREIRALAGELGIESPNVHSVRDLQSRLQRFVDAEARKVAALKGEMGDAYDVARRNLTDLQGWRAEVAAEVERLSAIDPALARELELTLRQLDVSDKGYLSYNDQDVWFHGISRGHEGVDLGTVASEADELGVRNTGEWDTFAAMHFAQNDEYARQYGRRPLDGAPVDAAENIERSVQAPEKVVGMRMRADNPVVFGGVDDWHAGRRSSLPDPGGGRGGAARGVGLREMHESMYDSAVRHGHIDQSAALRGEGADELADLFDDAMAAGATPVEALRQVADAARIGKVDPIQGLVDRLARAGSLDLIDDRAIARLRGLANVSEDAFGDGELAAQMAREIGEVAESGDVDMLTEVVEAYLETADDMGAVEVHAWQTSISDSEFFNAYIWRPWTGGTAVDNGKVTIDQMRAISASWAEDMRADGYDSFVYSLRADKGRWAAGVFDNAQLELAPIPNKHSLSVQGALEDAGMAPGGSADPTLASAADGLELGGEAVAAPRTFNRTQIDDVVPRVSTYRGDLAKLQRQTAVAANEIATVVRAADGPSGIKYSEYLGTQRTARQRLVSASGRWKKFQSTIDTSTVEGQQVFDQAQSQIDSIRGTLRGSDEVLTTVERRAREFEWSTNLHVTNNSRDLVTTIDNHAQALRYSRYGKVQEQFDLAGDMTDHITSMHGRIDEVERAARKSRTRADDLNRQLRDATVAREEGVDALIVEELGLRQRADDAAGVARRLEAEAQAAADEALSGANVDVLMAQRDRVLATAESLRLQAQADMAAAELTRQRGLLSDAEDVWSRMSLPDKVESTHRVIREGWTQVGANTLLPEEIVAGLQDVQRIMGHRSASKTLAMIDSVTELFKSWAIATPGFHMRNTFGGLFNNALAGVDHRRYGEFVQLYRPMRDAINQGLGMDAQVAALRGSKYGQRLARQGRGSVLDDMEMLVRNGVLNGGQSTELARAIRVKETGIRGQHLNPLNPNNAFTGAARRPATHIENMLRGTLAMDRLAKGQGVHAAVADVYKFHFDYDDLSAFERGVARRAIPFYTWTRKNLPLQLEMMVTNPKIYNRVNSLKREIERETEAEDVVPSFYADRFHIRMPFGGLASFLGSGSDNDVMYLVPDLPFTELDRALDPRQIIASSNPLLKTGLERLTNHSFFFDDPYPDAYRPVPEIWQVALAPVVPLLEAGGHVVRREDGRLMALPIDMAAVESFLPMLSQTRRLVPGDDVKVQDRLNQNLVNYWFGAGVRVNTDATRESEITSREFDQRDVARLESSLAAP